jgi:hypothetical protein
VAHLSHLGISYKFNVAISHTFAAIYEEPFPLHYCGIVSLPDVASGMILEQHSNCRTQQLWPITSLQYLSQPLYYWCHCSNTCKGAKLPIPQWWVIQNNSPWMTTKCMVSAVTEYLNFCHDGINTPMCFSNISTNQMQQFLKFITWCLHTAHTYTSSNILEELLHLVGWFIWIVWWCTNLQILNHVLVEYVDR